MDVKSFHRYLNDPLKNKREQRNKHAKKKDKLNQIKEK